MAYDVYNLINSKKYMCLMFNMSKKNQLCIENNQIRNIIILISC